MIMIHPHDDTPLCDTLDEINVEVGNCRSSEAIPFVADVTSETFRDPYYLHSHKAHQLQDYLHLEILCHFRNTHFVAIFKVKILEPMCFNCHCQGTLINKSKS